MKKILLLAVILFYSILFWPLAVAPVYGDTINLLSIWEADKKIILGVLMKMVMAPLTKAMDPVLFPTVRLLLVI